MTIERACASLGVRHLLLAAALGAASPASSGAQSLDVLHRFTGYYEAEGPRAALLVAADGYLYGTTRGGGTFNLGTIFRMTPSGSVTLLHSFAGGNDGAAPEAALIQASDGRIYGTTISGGAFHVGVFSGSGTAFRLEPTGDVTILHAFGGPGDASRPSVILQATDGQFYGIADNYVLPSGEANYDSSVYRMTADGSVTVLHAFPAAAGGRLVGLLQSSNGHFIGTQSGAVFSMTPGGTVTSLHAFTDAFPEAGVIEATDGHFYGTTLTGGTFNHGTVFRLTRAGVVTVLHHFTGGPDGHAPRAALLEAANGEFFGTTLGSTISPTIPYGSVFKVTSGGVFTVLDTFGDRPDGALSVASLVQTPAGTLYGTTLHGGISFGFGTVFTVDGSGAVAILHRFAGSVEGVTPNSLVEGTDGHFYGTTCGGGCSTPAPCFAVPGPVDSRCSTPFSAQATDSAPRASCRRVMDCSMARPPAGPPRPAPLAVARRFG